MFGVGLLLSRRHPRWSKRLLVTGLGLLIVLTNPWLVGQLQATVEYQQPISDARLSQAQAIVILGGGREVKAIEYGGADQVSAHGLLRSRYGAYLGRRSGLPLLVTGGSVRGESEAEAVLMARLIEDEFGVAVAWREQRSRNTYENAVFTAEMLAVEGIERIALVTSAMHMRRSIEAFERQGLTVYPAPTGINAVEYHPNARWLDYVLPNPSSLRTVTAVLHEVLGRLWYQLRYY